MSSITDVFGGKAEITEERIVPLVKHPDEHKMEIVFTFKHGQGDDVGIEMHGSALDPELDFAIALLIERIAEMRTKRDLQ